MGKKVNKNGLARDTVLFAISNFGSKILFFLLTPLYTSVLTTTDYGIADLLTTTINFIYPILTLAIAEAALRFALDKNESKGEVLGCSLLFTIVSSGLLLLITPITKFFTNELTHYWLYFVAIYALFNIHNTLINYLKGCGKTKHFAVQSILQALTIIISNVILLLGCDKGLEGYFVSMIIGYLFPIIYMLIFGEIYRDIPLMSLKKATVKKMLAYSLPMIPTLLAWAINASIDKYMIVGLIGLDENGLYSVAHKIPTLLTTVISIFLQAWQISAIENHGADDESEYYTKVYTGLNMVSILGVLGIIILTKPLANILFANDFYIAWKFVPMLTIASMFSSLSGFLASAYRAAKKTKSLFYSVLIGAIVNITLNFLLLKIIGTIGAAIATAISFAIVWLVRFGLIQKIVRIKINYIITAITYGIVLLLAIVYTTDHAYTGLIYLIGCIAVVLLNFQDILQIFKSTLSWIKSRGKV